MTENSERSDERASSDSGSLFVRCLYTAAVMALLAVPVVLLVSAVQQARNAAIASQSQSPLNQLSLALSNYHDAYSCLPPAYIADENGTPIHSWRVLVLPYIDGAELYREYNFAEPWNGPNNIKLADRMSSIYHSPSEPESTRFTNYVAIVGPETAFPGAACKKLKEFRDGAGQTILLAEIANSDICWLEPRDLRVDEMSFTVNHESLPSISSNREKGPYVIFASGITAYWLSEHLSPQALRSLTTIAGGEPMAIAATAIGLVDFARGPATDADLAILEQWEGVTKLWLSRSRVTDAGLARIAALEQLYGLDVSETNITGAGLRQFKRPPHYWLDVSRTDVSDTDLPHLNHLADTRSVTMADTNATLAGIVNWIRANATRDAPTVSVSGGSINPSAMFLRASSVTDADVEVLAQLSEARYIDLRETPITDAATSHLLAFQNVRQLYLNSTGVTDDGVAVLSQLSNVEHLGLGGTAITDACVPHLQKLQSLRGLDVSDTQITDEGIAALKVALPETFFVP